MKPIPPLRSFAIWSLNGIIRRCNPTHRILPGFRLHENQYLPILPDEDDALYLESVNLCIGLEGNRVWLEDGQTGEDLLNHLQVRRAWRAEQAARQAAEARSQAEEAARVAAQARIAELEAQLQRLQQR